jgi:hypothetical protein
VTAVAGEREQSSPVLAPPGLTEAEKDVLAELMRIDVAPKLIQAVLEEDAPTVQYILAGLEHQDLWALAVVLAEAAGAGP